jgi:hypothetical protein
VVADIQIKQRTTWGFAIVGHDVRTISSGMSRPEIGCLQNNQNGYQTTSHYRVFNARNWLPATGSQVWR